MPEATSRIPEIRQRYPNVYIEMRHSTPSWPGTDPKQWARSVKKFYDAHGNQVNGWAFLNEPDIEPGFPGWGQPIKDQVWAAAQWARECAEELKRICPNIRLHAPAFAFEDRGYGWPWFMETWKPVYELCEVVNSHNYWEHGGQYNPKALYDDPNDPNGLSYHHAFRYRQLRNWLVEYGIHKPIFIEECGNFAPDLIGYWDELAYYFRRLEPETVIGACVFILKSDKANWVNDLTRQPSINFFFEKLRGQHKEAYPYPAPATNPKIKVAVRLSWRVAFSPIIGHKELPLEEYLPDVLPREMGKDFNAPLEALKAQAIAARTYALRAMKYPRHGNDHICNSACCQVWAEGARYPLSDQALRETAGVEIRHGGQLIEAFYSANCGGRTINSEDRGWKPLPYCRSVPCPVGGTVSGHRVGLCQYGAREMARQGKNAEQILKHYYTGVTVNLPVPSPPPVVPPEPPAPPPSPPARKLDVISRGKGLPLIVGDVGEAGKELKLIFWDNEAKAISGSKAEYGPGGFELNYWRPANATFRLFLNGDEYLVEVKRDAPLTVVGWVGEEQPEPAPPAPPPTPPSPPPAPKEGPHIYDVDGKQRDWQWARERYGLPEIKRAAKEVDHWEVVELREQIGPVAMRIQMVGEITVGVPVRIVWRDDHVVHKTNMAGYADFVLDAYYRPPNIGPYSVYIDRDASDVVDGLGMLGKSNHAHLNLTFQFAKGGEG